MSKRVKSLRFQSSEMVFIKIFLLKDYILTQNRMVFPSYSWLRKRIILLVHLDMLYHYNWWLRKRKGSQLYLNWGGEGERKGFHNWNKVNYMTVCLFSFFKYFIVYRIFCLGNLFNLFPYTLQRDITMISNKGVKTWISKENKTH